jgi:lipid II:glycine glycyltransferase (peptidoglycan interpeptide bridge formation enzyme)
MLWRAIEALREKGVRVLDLGGVNTQRSAGIARFKMATGGQVRRLAGTYLL